MDVKTPLRTLRLTLSLQPSVDDFSEQRVVRHGFWFSDRSAALSFHISASDLDGLSTAEIAERPTETPLRKMEKAPRERGPLVKF